MAMLREAATRVPAGSPIGRRIDGVLKRRIPAGVHLGVFVEPFLEAILDGRKTVESRFALHRCPPFDRVQAGDVILLKRSGGPVVGIAVAGEARYYELDAEKLDSIRERYASKLYAEDDAFWDARSDKRFATLIDIDEVAPIATLEVRKRDRRGWVTYADAQQPCLALAG
jgi:ASC-1-like (ASCH) protein